MAYDYALVHLKFTIPLAAILTIVAIPFVNRTQLYKMSAMITVAVVATIPWDSYLIRNNVWTYPPDAIVGLRLFDIPAEEVFFFVIQTYITSLLYLIIQKPLLHAEYLERDIRDDTRTRKRFVQLFLVCCIAVGTICVRLGGHGTYLGLILAWASPFLLLSWSCGGAFILTLPIWSIALPIFLPTFYLWAVDELALGQGTWSIESDTKLGIRLWGSLEIEEAIFFLASNALIVIGLAAVDNGLATIEAFPSLFSAAPTYPTAGILSKVLRTSPREYDMERISGIREASDRLRKKSRSFHIASGAFAGRLRIDLTLLYSFCRMADDLIDDASTAKDQKNWLRKLEEFLDLSYGGASASTVREFIQKSFPRSTWSALSLLPTEKLLKKPLYQLLEGFRIDAEADHDSSNEKQPAAAAAARFPIKDEQALEHYAECVASTVGELCMSLIFSHVEEGNGGVKIPEREKAQTLQAARTMGIALQCVNIARDIQVDAAMGRVYIPSTWLKEEGLSHEEALLERPRGPVMERLRARLLDKAFGLYGEARPAMGRIPREARPPMIAAVESYMEIGRVVARREGFAVKRGRATVPKGRRVWVLMRALWSE